MPRFIRPLIPLLFLAAVVCAKPAEGPTMPAEAATPPGFIPAGWTMLRQAMGRVGGSPVYAAILEQTNVSPEPGEGAPRLLFLARRRETGQFALLLKNTRAILRSSEGGVMGEPLQGLMFEGEALVLDFAGGSRERWAYMFRFVPGDGAWALATVKAESYDSLTGAGESRRYDLVKGRLLSETSQADATDHVTSRPGRVQHLPVRPPILLAGFDASAVMEMIATARPPFGE
jgi:hypothetical protein